MAAFSGLLSMSESGQRFCDFGEAAFSFTRILLYFILIFRAAGSVFMTGAAGGSVFMTWQMFWAAFS